jgi:tetratricopeptide (TPR) repeat protein
MRFLAVLVLAVGGVCAAPPAALAEPAANVDRARKLVREGNALYQVGRFADAARLYEEAHRVRPRPGTMFNLAQCYRQLKNYERAIFLFRSYLELAPQAPDRADVEATITRLQKLLDHERSAQAGPPPPTTLKPSSGPVLPGGSSLIAEGAPRPEAAGAPAAAATGPTGGPADTPQERRWYQRWYTWAIVGLVVAGGVAGGVVAGTRGRAAPAGPPLETGIGNMDFFGGR